MHISNSASWYTIEHLQHKLFVMTAMSARHIFVVVYGRKTPPMQVANGQDLIRNVLVCKLHVFCLYMYLQPLQLCTLPLSSGLCLLYCIVHCSNNLIHCTCLQIICKL